jgi:hypothetical protein
MRSGMTATFETRTDLSKRFSGFQAFHTLKAGIPTNVNDAQQRKALSSIRVSGYPNSNVKNETERARELSELTQR